MELKDLIGKSVKDMTDEELEFKFREMKKLTLTAVKETKSKKPRAAVSNKEKQAVNMLKGLSPEALKALQEMIAERNK